MEGWALDDCLPNLDLPLDHHSPDLGNRFRRIEILGACLGAIHDGVAAVETEGVLEIIKALAGRFVAAVLQPAVRLQERRGAEKTLAVPPIAGTRGRTARAQNALIKTVQPRPIVVTLLPFLGRRGRYSLQPWLDCRM